MTKKKNHRPAYMQVAEKLELRRADLKKPLLLPSEPLLAGEFSVARGTIRQALRVLDDRGAVTRRKRVGTFLQPHRVAFKQLHGKSLGVVIPWWAERQTGSWFSGVVTGEISRIACEHGCRVSLLHVDNIPAHQEAWLEQIRAQGLSGIVWVHPQERQVRLLEKISKLFPTVVLGRQVDTPGLHHVLPDYDAAARMMHAFFQEQGVSCYALVSKNIMDPYNQHWLHGFTEAERAEGRTFDSVWRFFDYKCFRESDLGRLLIEFYLPYHEQRGNAFQGMMFLTSGYLASALRHKAFRDRVDAGLRIASINYGLHEIEDIWPGRKIPHIRCDWTSMARKTMELITLLANGRQAPQRILEPVTLVAD